MIRDAVTLHDSYYLIDTRAWLHQRVGAHQSEPSTHLQDFTRCAVFAQYQPAMDVAARMQLWCAAFGLSVGDGAVVQHDDEHLSSPVTIVLAATTGAVRRAFALVSVDGGPAEVYADVTTDEGYWRDTATICITCPDGHGWTWDDGAYLHTADGTEQRITALFGPGVRVISRCRDCTAFDDGTTADMCPCAGVAVYCPTCAQRCQIGLPEIPTFEETR